MEAYPHQVEEADRTNHYHEGESALCKVGGVEGSSSGNGHREREGVAVWGRGAKA